jgi:hypothetical protein
MKKADSFNKILKLENDLEALKKLEKLEIKSGSNYEIILELNKQKIGSLDLNLSLKENSNLKFFLLIDDCNIDSFNLDFTQKESDSNLEFYSVIKAEKQNKLNLKVINQHFGKNNTSLQKIRTVLKDNSSLDLLSLVKIKKGSYSIDSNQDLKKLKFK